MVSLRYIPWYVHGYPNLGMYMYDLKKGPSCNTGGIAKDSDKSSSG